MHWAPGVKKSIKLCNDALWAYQWWSGKTGSLKLSTCCWLMSTTAHGQEVHSANDPLQLTPYSMPFNTLHCTTNIWSYSLLTLTSSLLIPSLFILLHFSLKCMEYNISFFSKHTNQNTKQEKRVYGFLRDEQARSLTCLCISTGLSPHNKSQTNTLCYSLMWKRNKLSAK